MELSFDFPINCSSVQDMEANKMLTTDEWIKSCGMYPQWNTMQSVMQFAPTDGIGGQHAE